MSATFAYRQLFSWLPPHDDEGYVMMSVRYLLRGRRIYDDVPILFGPAFFLYEWIAHGVLHVPLTHDVIRVETFVIWLSCVAFLGLFVAAVASTIAFALAAQFAILSSLILFSNEPGHPQEFIVLCVTLVLVVSLARARGPMLAMGLLGVTAAVVFCTKANLGIFVLVALSAAALADTRPSVVLLTLRAGVVILFVGLPWFMLGVKGDRTEWAIRYAGLVSLAAIPVAVQLWKGRGRAGWPELGMMAAGFMLASVGFFTFAFLHGSSAAAMWECLWVMPRRLAPSTTPPPIGSWSVAVVAAALGVALPRMLRYPPARVCLWVLKAAFALVVLFPRIPFDFTFLLDYAAPWLWVTLVRVEDGDRTRAGFPCTVAVTCAVLLMLWAYPVPGSQLALSGLLLPVAAAIAAADVVAVARAFFPRMLGRPAVGAAALLAVLFLVGRETISLRNFATDYYNRSVPLELPGATHVRLDPVRVAWLTTLARTLRDAPDTFLATDGFYSMYFWTGKEPPSPILITHVMDIYTAQQQDALAAALLSRPEALLVMNPTLSEFRGEYRKPFYQGLFRFFESRETIGPFVIKARRR
ncbi:MAG TPA: hypothetical protein VKU61_11095 [Candidatus Binatia bacterium]|nr:hypothetical protein [Candidatus Binatia bacterium]